MKKVKKQKPSEAWVGYCLNRKYENKCVMVYYWTKNNKCIKCKNNWMDKHCELRRGK